MVDRKRGIGCVTGQVLFLQDPNCDNAHSTSYADAVDH